MRQTDRQRQRRRETERDRNIQRQRHRDRERQRQGKIETQRDVTTTIWRKSNTSQKLKSWIWCILVKIHQQLTPRLIFSMPKDRVSLILGATHCCSFSPACAQNDLQRTFLEHPGHTPNIAFRHLPPNSARFSYATEGTLETVELMEFDGRPAPRSQEHLGQTGSLRTQPELPHPPSGNATSKPKNKGNQWEISTSA